MFSVYLVEDESAVRNAIRDRIEWQSQGFAYVGEAPDGEVALREIRELRPDLVITDIRMPFLDGLQLSRHLRELFSRIRIVILTGHDDFEYAQEAIRCGVNDYLLKPLSAAKLHATLGRLNAEMLRERQEGGLGEASKATGTMGTELARDELVRRLCQGLRDEAPLTAEERHTLGIGDEFGHAVVLLIQAGRLLTTKGARSVGSVWAYLRWLTSDAPGYFALPVAQDVYAVVITHPEPELLDEKAVLLAATVKEIINEHFGLSALVSIGRSVPHITSLHSSYSDAMELLDQDTYTDRVLFRSQLSASKHATIVQRVAELVRDRYHDSDLSLTYVAEHVAVSPSRLSTLFHQETGEKFISFLNRTRLDVACRMLETTDLTIADIAERCGYNQAHYFSSLFSRFYGVSPGRYRKREERATPAENANSE